MSKNSQNYNQTSQLPIWLTLQNLLSFLALISIIGSFFINNATQGTKLESVENDVKELKKTMSSINTKVAKIEGKLEK